MDRRRVAEWSKGTFALSALAFVLLLGFTGGGMSHGSAGLDASTAFGLTMLSLLTAIVSFTVWLVVGLPLMLRLPEKAPADLEDVDEVPDATSPQTTTSGMVLPPSEGSAEQHGEADEQRPVAPSHTGRGWHHPVAIPLSPETRELLAREFRRQSYLALRIPLAVFVLMLLWLASSRNPARVAPLDPTWVPSDAVVGGLLVGLICLAVGVLQFVSEERPRRRDLSASVYLRATGKLYTQEVGSGRGSWFRLVFAGGGNTFIPVVRWSPWRFWEWLGIARPLRDGRLTLDYTEQYKYVLAARDRTGALVYRVPGYVPPDDAAIAPTPKADAPSPATSVVAALAQPVPIALGVSVMADLILLLRRFA